MRPEAETIDAVPRAPPSLLPSPQSEEVVMVRDQNVEELRIVERLWSIAVAHFLQILPVVRSGQVDDLSSCVGEVAWIRWVYTKWAAEGRRHVLALELHS